MCGIVGFTSERREVADRIAEAQQRRLRHRGLDGHGTWYDSESGVLFSHLRLAVVDLTEAGAQPMRSRDGTRTLVFNGEIYNAESLKSELIAAGESFRGHSDTEVLLVALGTWGLRKTLDKSVGMFAFAHWNSVSKEMLLARDRFGEKPLYYWHGGGRFAFASQPGAFLDLPWFDGIIDPDSLHSYFRHGFVRGDKSIYKGVYRLPPGTFLELKVSDWTSGCFPVPQRYWNLRELAARLPVKMEIGEATDRLAELIDQSVALQMVADVPLGAFLSGGIDSSVVVASMQAQSVRPIKTFSIGFAEKQYDESPHARAVARHLGTDHHELIVGQNDALGVVPDIHRIWDEPFADASQIPTFLVSKLARQSVTVALSGDGGDELFSGYTRYFELEHRWRRLNAIPWPLRHLGASALSAVPSPAWDWMGAHLPVSAVRRRRKLLAESARRLGGILRTSSPAYAYRDMVSSFDDPGYILRQGSERRDGPWDLHGFDSNDLIAGAALCDAECYLPDDILTKVDRASMAMSLEARVPLLDYRIAEFAASLPRDLKVSGGTGKKILREVLYRRVPRELVERPKMGFGVPIGDWLRNELRDWAESLLDERGLEEEGHLHVRRVRAMWTEHLEGRRDWGGRIWVILMFQSWLRGRYSV